MKKQSAMKYLQLAAALLCAASLTFSSCSKSDGDSNTATPRRWVKTYSNIVIGDDENDAEGQFLNTRTGQVVKLRNSASVRSQLSLLYSVTYGGASYLTAPANLDAEDPYNTDRGPIYEAPGLGILDWSSNELNSIELYHCDMTAAQFGQISDWKSFDNAFRINNDGEPDLSAGNSIMGPSAGQIYLLQINGSLRCIAQVITASNSQTTGFIKLNIIVEGREDMSSAGKALMPAE